LRNLGVTMESYQRDSIARLAGGRPLICEQVRGSSCEHSWPDMDYNRFRRTTFEARPKVFGQSADSLD